MAYEDLTDGEQAHWGEYTNLRGISDWPGFDAAQNQRKTDSRQWLEDRRAELWHDLNDEPVNTAENKEQKRQQRWEYLKDDNLNNGAPKHEVRLPCPGSATDTEKVYLEEREQTLAWGSTTDAQKARKTSNVDWLVARRKELYHLMEDDPAGNEANDREARYDALCIATHHGSAYEEWEETHNKWGEPISDSGGGKGRSACKDWLEKHLGTNENPPSSNKGQPEPSGWQNRVYGDDGVPWCACFAGCSAWDNGVSGSVTAGVYNNTQLAKQGQGIYRGYTTDRSKLHAGDHAFINSDHTGVVYDLDNIVSIEGNTSPGSEGSQYNGGTVAKRDRGSGYWTGYGLVRFDD